MPQYDWPFAPGNPGQHAQESFLDGKVHNLDLLLHIPQVTYDLNQTFVNLHIHVQGYIYPKLFGFLNRVALITQYFLYGICDLALYRLRSH